MPIAIAAGVANYILNTPFNSLFEMQHDDTVKIVDVDGTFNSLFEMREGSQGKRCGGAVALFQFSI